MQVKLLNQTLAASKEKPKVEKTSETVPHEFIPTKEGIKSKSLKTERYPGEEIPTKVKMQHHKQRYLAHMDAAMSNSGNPAKHLHHSKMAEYHNELYKFHKSDLHK